MRSGHGLFLYLCSSFNRCLIDKTKARDFHTTSWFLYILFKLKEEIKLQFGKRYQGLWISFVHKWGVSRKEIIQDIHRIFATSEKQAFCADLEEVFRIHEKAIKKICFLSETHESEELSQQETGFDCLKMSATDWFQVIFWMKCLKIANAERSDTEILWWELGSTCIKNYIVARWVPVLGLVWWNVWSFNFSFINPCFIWNFICSKHGYKQVLHMLIEADSYQTVMEASRPGTALVPSMLSNRGWVHMSHVPCFSMHDQKVSDEK